MIFTPPHKKYLLILICNIALIIIFLFCIDYLIYAKYKNDYIKNTEHLEIYPPISYIDNYRSEFSPQTFTFQIKNKKLIETYRYKYNDNYKNKKSIIIFGCSFAFGELLEDNQTISYKLSNITKRNIFNFGMNACGIQHMLSLLQNEVLYKYIKQDPEYIIYVYIPDHLYRLKENIFPAPMTTNGINLQYKLINNTLMPDKKPFNMFSKTFIIKSLYYQFDLNRNIETKEQKYNNFILANELFLESKRILQEKYPDIKFVILNYECEDDSPENIELPFMWDVLKQEGFIIINSSDLIGRKFKYYSEDTADDDYHPSEKAWNLLVPKLIERLNL